MKLTTANLKQIIKEELESVLENEYEKSQRLKRLDKRKEMGDFQGIAGTDQHISQSKEVGKGDQADSSHAGDVRYDDFVAQTKEKSAAHDKMRKDASRLAAAKRRQMEKEIAAAQDAKEKRKVQIKPAVEALEMAYKIPGKERDAFIANNTDYENAKAFYNDANGIRRGLINVEKSEGEDAIEKLIAATAAMEAAMKPKEKPGFMSKVGSFFGFEE